MLNIITSYPIQRPRLQTMSCHLASISEPVATFSSCTLQILSGSQKNHLFLRRSANGTRVMFCLVLIFQGCFSWEKNTTGLRLGNSRESTNTSKATRPDVGKMANTDSLQITATDELSSMFQGDPPVIGPVFHDR